MTSRNGLQPAYKTLRHKTLERLQKDAERAVLEKKKNANNYQTILAELETLAKEYSFEEASIDGQCLTTLLDVCVDIKDRGFATAHPTASDLGAMKDARVVKLLKAYCPS